MAKKFMDKIKEGVSVQEVEDFVREYTMEVFSVLAIIIASISAMYDFFTGPKLAIAFVTIGIICGIFFPAPIEKGFKQFFKFAKGQEKTTQIILGVVKVVIALFVPFVLFCAIGLLAGISYHYFNRHVEHEPATRTTKSRARSTEHD